MLNVGQSAMEEVECWKRVFHPNVAMLFEHIIDPSGEVIVMQLINGKDLYGVIDSAKVALPETDAKLIILQLCLAVRACHDAGVAHRDIKLENILLDSSSRLYLCDFGLAAEISSGLLTDFCGSTAYTAPEVLLNTPYDGRLGDVWSIGVVMYAVLRGCLPFSNDDRASCGSAEDSERAVKIQVLEGVYSQPEVSEDAIDLLHHTLCPVQGRYSLSQILSHPWLKVDAPIMRELPDPYLAAKLLVDVGFDEAIVSQCLSEKIPNALYGLIHILAYKRLLLHNQ